MGKITLDQDRFGSFTLRQVDGPGTIPIHTDWDYAGVAASFGWSPCPCGATDGTMDCAHRTASEMIHEAATFLDDAVGRAVDDPGYFD